MIHLETGFRRMLDTRIPAALLTIVIAWLPYILPEAVRDTAAAGVQLERTWGEFGNALGEFHQPKGIVVGPEGRVFVIDTQNDRIQIFSPEGELVDSWGNFPPPAGFERPSDLVFHQGKVLVSNSNSGVNVYTEGGQYLGPLSITGNYTTASAITLDDEGNYYIAETIHDGGWAGRVEKVDASGNSITLFGSEYLNAYPGGIVVTPRWILVSDTGRDRVLRFSTSGAYIGEWLGPGRDIIQVRSPHGLTTDDSGHIYLADTENHRIQVFTSWGQYLMSWGTFGVEPGEFRCPWDVAVDASGAVYVTDTFNHRVQKFKLDFSPTSPTPVYPTTWGQIKTKYR